MDNNEEIIDGGQLPGIGIIAPMTWKARNNIKARRGRQYVNQGQEKAFPFVATTLGVPLATTMAPLLVLGTYQAVPKIAEAMNIFNPSTFLGKGAYNTVLGSTGRSLTGATADAVVASAMGAEGIKLFKDDPSVTTGLGAAISNIPTVAGTTKAIHTGILEFPKLLDKSAIGQYIKNNIGVRPSKLLKPVKKVYLWDDAESLEKDFNYYSSRFDDPKNTYEHYKSALSEAISNIINNNQNIKNNKLELLNIDKELEKMEIYKKFKKIILNNASNNFNFKKNPYIANNQKSHINFSKISLEDYEKLLKQYPEAFRNNYDGIENSEEIIKSGDISVPIFGTDKKQTFNIPAYELGSWKLKPGYGLYQINLKDIPQSPKEYQEVLKHNILYILKRFPGWRPYGSSVLASEGLPHATHDFDGMMTEEAYNKWKSTLSPEELNKIITLTPNETYRYPMKEYGKAGNVDINILKIDPITGKGNSRAVELFRLFYPDDYEKAGMSLATRDLEDKSRFVPIRVGDRILTTDELLEAMDPAIKTIMDSQESFKPKHRGRAHIILETVNPKLVRKANNQSAKMLFGNNYTLLPDDIDMGTELDRKLALLDIGLSESQASLFSKYSEITRNYIELYLLTNPKLFRATNPGDKEEHSGTIKKLLRNAFEYNPNPPGGDASGGGINYVIDGNSGHYRTYYVSVQPTEGLKTILKDHTNIKNVIPAIKKYLNLNEGKIYKNDEEFLKYLDTDFTVNNLTVKPFGFTGKPYWNGSGIYFGAGPINPSKNGTRIFPSPEITGGFLGYYKPIIKEKENGALEQRINSTRIINNQNKNIDYSKGLWLTKNNALNNAITKIFKGVSEKDLNDLLHNIYTKLRNAHNIKTYSDLDLKSLISIRPQVLEQINLLYNSAMKLFESYKKTVLRYNRNKQREYKSNVVENILNKFKKVINWGLDLGMGLGLSYGIDEIKDNIKHRSNKSKAYRGWFNNSIYSDILKKNTDHLPWIDPDIIYNIYNLDRTKGLKAASKYILDLAKNANNEYVKENKELLQQVANNPLYEKILKYKDNPNLFKYLNSNNALLLAIKLNRENTVDKWLDNELKSYARKLLN